MSINVSNPSGDPNEKIANAAKIMSRAKVRMNVFLAIYDGKKRVKTVSDIMRISGLRSNVRVLQEGKRLASEDIVKQMPGKVNGETAYQKIDFYAQNKKQIIRLATNKDRLKKYPTRSNPHVHVESISASYPRRFVDIRPVTIDDIDSFRRVRNVKTNTAVRVSVAESDFKAGLKKVLGEGGRFVDWGGETNDLFTTRLVVNGKRLPAAFGLKGKGTVGILTPGKMGKNGDQIQRLFSSPAIVFLVQYNDQIASSVLDQMRSLAIAKSVASRDRIYFGTIDGQDTARLMIAYSREFHHTRND